MTDKDINLIDNNTNNNINCIDNNVNLFSIYEKLYLFKNGEFLSVKMLFHLPFLNSGSFSNNLAFSNSKFLENANILSPIIPIFFLISQLSIFWNDTDLTGQ